MTDTQEIKQPGLEVKSHQLEIERKYKSKAEEWNSFVDLCKSLNPVEELYVEGPDTYYDNGKNVIRWRYSQDLSELTVKARYSTASTLVREELDISMTDTSVRTILRFIKTLGFSKLFRIKKYCHIFWFDDEEGQACVVIYRVTCKNEEDKYFIEIEAPKGISIAQSKDMIRRWEKKLNIQPHKRINESLFEIYSGRVTPLIDKINDTILCIACNERKQLSDFYPSWLKKSGSKCKKCCSEQNLTEQALKTTSERNRERRKTDIQYRLKTQLRNRINSVIKNKGTKKVGSAVTGLGCTVDDLKKHLESKFYPNATSGTPMTWKNWGLGFGKWQIDHVKALSSFNLEDRLEFLKACHFTNLQPLWHEDHAIKTKVDLSSKKG
jgi:adenylate cyclase class IV